MDLEIQDHQASKHGLGRVIIKADARKLLLHKLDKVFDTWMYSYVLLKANNRTVAGIVESMVRGEDVLLVDPYLRHDLQVSAGDTVTVEPLKPQIASEVVIARPPGDFSEGELVSLCRTYLLLQPLSIGQRKLLYLFSGEEAPIEIIDVKPENFAVLTRRTTIKTAAGKAVDRKIHFSMIGGMKREIDLLRERIIWPMKNRTLFSTLGIQIPKGILLTGPPGCGKTLLARALATELGVRCIEVRGPEIFAALYGESESRIRKIFEDARKATPSMVLIDEIDALAPSRSMTRGDLERRVVTMLLTELDGLQEQKDLIVIGTTNTPDALDLALRRPGRFDYEIRIHAPSVEGRLEILQIHSQHMPLVDVELQLLALKTHGFSGADLMNLCREAAFQALKRQIHGKAKPAEALESLTPSVAQQDFEAALRHQKPSLLREFAVETPAPVNWDDIGGMEAIKSTLMEEIVRAIKHPEGFARMGVRPVRGILLYGPPGTGKTLLARVIASQAGSNFIAVRGPEMLSMWFGESEKRIRDIFTRAREVSPCIIFFDEIDAITAQRGKSSSDAGDRLVNQVLTEMDGFSIEEHVCVIAATNRKDILDPALLRPGRFDHQILVPLPTLEERRKIFEIHLRRKPCADGLNLEVLAENSKNLSGAHIEEITRRAALEALQAVDFDATQAQITQANLATALEKILLNVEYLEKKRPVGFVDR